MGVGPIARAVWDYLICNQQDHASGLYRLSIATSCEDTGWTVEQFEGALGELEEQGLILRDPRLRLVWVINMLRKSYRNPTDKQLKSVESHLASMPRSALIARMVAYYAETYGLRIPFGGDSGSRVTPSERATNGVPPPLGSPPGGSLSASDRIGIGSASESVGCGALDPPPPTCSGELHELDIIRRAAEAKHGRQIGGLSRSPSAGTVEGLAAALASYGWDYVRAVVTWAADQTAQGLRDERLWRRMFRGDGFEAWRHEYDDDERKRAKRAAELAPTPEPGPSLDPNSMTAVLRGADFMRRAATQ